MPPMRVGGGSYWHNDNWFVRMGLLHAFGQSDLGVNDTPTAGYNLLKIEISNKRYWRYSPWGPTEITTGLVGDNLLDVDVRNSVQFHKDEILLPGRSITAGLAVGEVMTAGTVFGFNGGGNPFNTIVSSHNTKTGWTAGGGVEARLVGNWTGKLEYLYLDLGAITTVPAQAQNSTVAVAFNSRVTDNIVRLGLNYKFDPNTIRLDD
jgi:opacity protein-like surface antigen